MQGFTWLDATVLVGYLVGIAALGSFLGRGQKDVGDYFLGGRTFHWFPIALSVIATDLSAITYMGSPALAFQHDLRYMLGIFMAPLAVVITVPLVVTVFYRMKIFTIYEYLEHRYGSALRILASSLFLILRGGWLATAIYVPSLALSVVAGFKFEFCILSMGLFASFYATVGGFKGVIWCDVVQFFILVGGVFVAIIVVLMDFGGDVSAVWSIAAAQGRTRVWDFNPSLTAEFAFWSVTLGSLVSYISCAGADQVTVQRYLSARSIGTAIKSAVAQSLIVIPVVVPMFLVGTFLVAYYDKHPEMMQSLLALSPNKPVEAMDRVLPHFVVHALPAGLGGLVVAGIMAATMSSLDAGMNSLANVAVTDYYRRFFHTQNKDEHHYLRVSRAATVFFGATATILAFFVGQLGTIMEIMGKIQGFLTGPLVAMFLLGVLTKRANGVGVFLGSILGLVVVGYASRSGVFWAWYGPVGLVASAILGYALSVLWSAATGNPDTTAKDTR